MSLIVGVVIIVLILCVTMTIWLIIQKTSHIGSIIIQQDVESGITNFTLELDTDPYDMKNMKTVSFKVVNKE